MIETRFKNTQLGKTPIDWQYSSLASIGEVKMCKRILKEQTSIHGDIPFYKIGTFGNEADAYIPRHLFELYKRLYSYPQIGTILISAAGTIGRTVVYCGEEAYFQDSNIVWIDNNEDKVINSYLNHYFKIIKWKSEKGGTITRLYNENLRSTFLIYPIDKKEQNRIATTLSDVDNLISTLENLIEKKKNIKQGVMQELLSGKRRLPGFKDKWEEDRLCNHFTNGSTNGAIVKWRASCYPKPGLFKAFSASGQDVWVDYKMYNCDAIVISAVGEHCGKCFLARGEWSVVANTHILLGDKSQYMPYWIYIFDNESFWQRGGSGQPFVQVKATLNKTMPLPSYDEQIAIAQVLSDMDTEVSILDERLEKFKALKQGMMQQLLTGKIRLI